MSLDYRSHSPQPSQAASHASLHLAAIVTLCFTFPLIFLGGLVTSHHAGMSVPDWPNSYGYNMFLFPPSKWVGGIFYEHTHRLLGTIVGFCAIILTCVAWGPARSRLARGVIVALVALLELGNGAMTAAMVRFPDAFHLPVDKRAVGDIVPHGAVTGVGVLLVAVVAWLCRRPEPRMWVRWLATACLVAVCVQGLLGGLRVDLINLSLAMVHGCFAQATFCLMVVTAAVTGSAWQRLPARRPLGRWVVALSYLTVAVVFAQLIVAAVMRHLNAGLAIPDLPLAYGHWLPPTNADQLRDVNHQRVWKLGLETVTMAQVWLHFAHRIGAIVVSAVSTVLVAALLRRSRRVRALAAPAAALAVLLLTQATLGVCTVCFRKPADVASAHVACGALVLATTVLIAVRASRVYQLGSRKVPSDAEVAGPTAGELVAV